MAASETEPESSADARAEAKAKARAAGRPVGAGEERTEEMPAEMALGRSGEAQIGSAVGSPLADERSDAQVIQAVLGGDTSAFALLVRRYSERAYRAAYRVLRDPHQSEDVVQEALIKAYRALDGFELRSSFYTWLYKIVVNLALDRRRKDGRAPSVEWDDRAAQHVDPRAARPDAGNPELDSRRRQVREFVAQGVQELPDGQREVLLLREVEGLSYEEIAKTMQISKGTVMSRLHYARKKMVAFLAQCGIEPEDVS